MYSSICHAKEQKGVRLATGKVKMAVGTLVWVSNVYCQLPSVQANIASRVLWNS